MCLEPTELRLIGCSTELTWSQRSQSNMLTPETNLLTCWAKGASRDEWNHLLRLLNITNFSMFSCSHLSIRSESRAPCPREVRMRLPVRVHQWQSPNQRFQRRRDRSTWCCTARGARGKILHKTWDERKGDLISTRKTCADHSKSRSRTFSSETTGECSKFRFFETAQSRGSFALLQHRETCASSKFKNGISSSRTISAWQRFSIFCRRSWKLQKHTQRSQWQHWRQLYWYGECLWLHRWKPSFILDRIIWRTWKSTRTRTSRKFRAYSISHKNWCWSILKRFLMWIRLTVHLFPGQDQYCPTIKWFSGQKQKYVPIQIPFCAWGRWMEAMVQLKDGKVKCKNSKCPFLIENCWEPMEKQLNSSVIFSQDFRHCRFFRRSTMICEKETLTDRIIFMSMFNDIDWTNMDGICVPNSENVKDYAKKFLQGRRTFLGNGEEKKWYGTLPYTPQGKWDFCSQTGGGQIQRHRSSSIQEYQCFWVAEFCKRRMAEIPYTSTRMLWTQSSCSKLLIL